MSDYSTGVKMLDLLQAFGVEAVFTSPGSEWPVLWEALEERAAEDLGPRAYSSRHEELAVMQAVGYSLKAGSMTAVALHGSLGLLKAAMAVRYAYHAGVPMVVLTGETASFGEGVGLKVGEHWQRSQSDEGGPAALAQPFVKRSMRVSSPDVLLGTLYDACRTATAAPQGPVLVSIPQEFLHAHLPEASIAGATPWTLHPDPHAVAHGVVVLLAAERPMIVTQSAGRRVQDFDALVELAESLAIPVFDGSSPGYVNFPTDHPLFQGSATRADLEAADVLLTVACPVPWFPASSRPASIEQVLLVDEYPTFANLPYWGISVDQCLAGDISITMGALAKGLREAVAGDPDAKGRVERRGNALSETHDRRREALASDLEGARDTWPVDTRWLGAELASLLPDDAILLEEVTTDKANIIAYAGRRLHGTFFGRTSGGLGLVMGMASGVKLAAPGQLVVQVLGDGGFHYSPALAAFGFAQEYDCPILTVVCNNESYASMVEAHLRHFPDGWGKRTGMKSVQIPSPAYAALARAYGGWGERVDRADSLRPLLRTAIDRVLAGESALLDVPTTPGKRKGKAPSA